MRRLIAALATRLGLRPRPSVETAKPPTVRAPRQADPARTGTPTTGQAPPRRPPATRSGAEGSDADRAVRTRPPAPRQRARVVTTPPARGRRLVYAPELDGRADPGEIVWAWVPYEEDPARGKDRPVLVVGRDGATLLGLMLSSNADRDGQPHWYALGTGAWDRQHRPSWVRLDRVLLVQEDGIRREGDILARPRFEAIARVLREKYGWQ
jgi:PemK-like protein.